MAEIRAEMIFSTLMLWRVHSNLLVWLVVVLFFTDFSTPALFVASLKSIYNIKQYKLIFMEKKFTLHKVLRQGIVSRRLLWLYETSSVIHLENQIFLKKFLV